MFFNPLWTVNWLIYSLLTCVSVLVLVYLAFVNYLLKGVPSEVEKLSSPRWTTDKLKMTYDELDEQSIDYTKKLPPRLSRRYIVVGGNGKTTLTTPAYMTILL
jgi:hypothetical protein